MVRNFWKFLATGNADWVRDNLPPDLARIYLTGDKMVRREYAMSLLPDLKYASVFVSHVPVEEALDTIMATGEGFIKPVNGRNSYGCFPLKREGDKLVAPVIGEKTVEGWASYLIGSIAKARDIKPLWLVEEVLNVRLEVKVTIFAPRAFIVFIVRREWVPGKKPVRHIIETDRDGNVIDTVSARAGLIKSGHDLMRDRLTVEDIPKNLHEFVEKADRLGELIHVPTIRLDMYDTDDGIYYSEITRRSELFRYSSDSDMEMYFERWKASVEWLKKEGKCRMRSRSGA